MPLVTFRSTPVAESKPQTGSLKVILTGMGETLVGLLAVVVIETTVGGVVSTVQVKLAGLASVLPRLSLARTWKVWLPPVRLL